ncbi:MAG: hypothetical protein LAO03_01035 [Acidobacteriia bacterium]|nr:hypothetical protein [Terriglobia bacterium]
MRVVDRKTGKMSVIFDMGEIRWPGEWGVILILVDPYSLKKQGLVECRSFQMVDIGLTQPAQLAAIQEAKLS